jgi:hypothetical protein
MKSHRDCVLVVEGRQGGWITSAAAVGRPFYGSLSFTTIPFGIPDLLRHH